MPIETAQYIGLLNEAIPAGGDAAYNGDDEIRAVKKAVRQSLPYVTGAVIATHTELNYVDGVTSAIQTQLNAKDTAIALKGTIAGQTWTGAHVFTGATVTVAEPSSGASPVTKTYADALAFSSALPGILAATKDKLVTNNGSVASWADTPMVTAESFFMATF